MIKTILSYFREFFKKFDNFSDFTIKVGAELEFYYDSDLPLNVKHSNIKKIENILLEQKLIDDIIDEEGNSQFEIHFQPEHEIENLIYKINKVKEILITNNCILTARPKEDSPGSSIHFNFSLFLDEINLFQKNPKTNEYLVFLYQAIAGMLFFLKESIYIFAPTEECYKRFKIPFENNKWIHCPVNCSWGFENRTVAIRVPTILSKKYPENRIEHRVCSVAIDVEKSLSIILYSIYYGIANFLEPIEPTFGNAFSFENEHLDSFPVNLEKAQKIFMNGKLKKILNFQ